MLSQQNAETESSVTVTLDNPPIGIVTYGCGCQDVWRKKRNSIVLEREEQKHGCESRFGRACERS